MLVSIVTPAYNCERFLEKCINSLISQTYRHIEIIIVDDGSTDMTASIIRKYCKLDNRIKYYYQANGGASSARNYGISRANGKYLLFVDSDDYIDKDLVKKTVTIAEKNQSDVVCFGHYKVFGTKQIPYLFDWNCDKNYDGKFALQKILSFSIKGYICDKLFRLDKWNNLKLKFENGRYCEDWPPISQYIGESKVISFINEPLYYYVQNDSSAIHTSNLKIVKDYDHAAHQILKLQCVERQPKEDKIYFKAKTQLEIFHELYNIATRQRISVYKIANENGLPSFQLGLTELLFSKTVNMDMKLKYLIWKFRLYGRLKKGFLLESRGER